MKQNTMKVLSIFVILAMIVSVSAQGADLSTYPTIFVGDDKFNGKIAVGKNADVMDVIAAFFIADKLRTKEIEIFEPGQSATGDIPIGSSITSTSKISQELTDSDIGGLLDGTIRFNNDEYDVSEMIILGQNGNNVSIESSLTSSEDDYKTDIVMEVARKAIKYYYNFDESIDLTKATTTNPLTISVLGKKIKITEIISDTKFTAFVGDEYFLHVDEEVKVDDKTVKLVNVGSGGAIIVDVDGILETIPSSQTRRVNGIEINNHETFYTDDKMDRAAFLIVGKEAVKTYTDGDAFIGEDKNNPDWIWNIGNLQTVGSSNPSISGDGTGPYVGIENQFVINDDSDNPPVAGESISLPFGYITIKLDKLTVKDDDYRTYKIEYDRSADLSDALGDQFTSARTVLISTRQDEGLVVRGSILSTPNITSDVKTTKIWLYGEDENNLDVLYLDKNTNKVRLAGKITNDTTLTFGEINYKNTKGTDISIKANFSPTNSTLTLTLNPSTSDISNDDLEMTFSLEGYTVRSLGSSGDTEETDELKWNGNNIGTKNSDLRTKYGIIVKNPRSNGASDEVELEIPSDEVQARVIIYGVGTETKRETVKILDFPKITFDTDLTGSEKNLILIGGPAANSKTAELLNIPYGTVGNFPAKTGEALVKLIQQGDKNYLIIAGYTKEDTRKAVEMMANYENNKDLLKGRTEIIINVNTL